MSVGSKIRRHATPDHFLHYRVMAFGLCNALATFQCLMNKMLAGVSLCKAYIIGGFAKIYQTLYCP